MSRFRPSQGPAISLFPFLAVLLCTMGALLVLLVLFSRASREKGSAREELQAQLDLEQQLIIERDSLIWRLDQIETIRVKTSRDLSEARIQLAGIEEHVQTLTDELNDLDDHMRSLEVADTAEETPASEIEALEQELKSARESLREKRRVLESRPAKYAVVAFDGPSGTHRRPLYIECCIDGVFLQPEGIRLNPSDFAGPAGPGNPLASALRAAREYIAETTALGSEAAVQPYPLLLVRPSGVMAYYEARDAIQSWGSDFGYQLINEDWTLEFPPRDPALAEIEKRAVAESRERLAWLMSRRSTRPSRPTKHYRASTTRGGVVADEGPSLLGDQSQWDWARQQAARGMQGGDGGGTGFGGGSGNGFGDEEGAGNKANSTKQSTGSRGGVALGDSLAGGSSELFPALVANTAKGNLLSGQSLTSGKRIPYGSNALVSNDSRSVNGTRVEGSSGETSEFPGARGQNVSGNNQAGVSVDSPNGAGGMAQGTSANQSAGSGFGQGGQQASGAKQGSGASGGTGGSALTASMTTSPMAQARGKNWASLATADHPVPLTRPIQVECSYDELRVFDDAGRTVIKRIPIGSDTGDCIDPLVKNVHKRVAGWGLAGDRMYWNPQLVLSQTADGQSRLEDIEQLLADSGLETRRKGKQDVVRQLPSTRQTSSRRRVR